MDDVLHFFRETQETFTIYAVEQRFAVGRGREYFKSFQGKENYIDSNTTIQKHISRILIWIQKKVPSLSELMSSIKTMGPSYSIIDAITILNKLFSAHFHQAAGPEVIDPIIINEEKIKPKYIDQIITLHERSVLRPVIILILKDNDMFRAKELLSHCPNGINIKFIKNSGECEIVKVVNTGAEDVTGFMNAYTEQCFSTCSSTPRKILLNDDWAQNDLLNKYMNELLRIRAALILDEKELVHNDIVTIIRSLKDEQIDNSTNQALLQCMLCTAELMQVYCNDASGQDIQVAFHLAKASNNDLLRAQVYRYAYFLEQFSEHQQIELLTEGDRIFSQYGMMDQALYCRNNRLTYQFEQERIYIHDFRRLQEEALYNTPGLVGMSYILNNTGVAYLLDGDPEQGIIFLNKGMEYAQRQDRALSRFAIRCNTFIARACCFDTIKETELISTLNQMMDSSISKQFPFICARLALNIVAISARQNQALGKNLLERFPIEKLINSAFSNNLMGSEMLLLQMESIKRNSCFMDSFKNVVNPPRIINVKGLHRDFILRHGLNPFVFCTWL